MKKFLLLLCISSLSFGLESEPNDAIEKLKKDYNVTYPEAIISNIAEEAFKNCNFTTKPIILQSDSWENSGTGQLPIASPIPYIILGRDSQNTDNALTIFTAYHECGHIFHEDYKKRMQSNKNLINCMKYGLLASVLTRISCSILSLQKTSSVCITLSCFSSILVAGIYSYLKINHAVENNADQFAYRKLLEINRPEIIIAWIFYNLSAVDKNGKKQFTDLLDEHRSDFGRAQEAVIFLQNNNISLDALSLEQFPNLSVDAKKGIPLLIEKYLSK